MGIPQSSDWKPRESRSEITKRFYTNMNPSQDAVFLHGDLRGLYSDLAEKINDGVLDSREKSVALTELESSFRWLGKAIFQEDEHQKAQSDSEGNVEARTISPDQQYFWDGKYNPHLENWLGDKFVRWDSYESGTIPAIVFSRLGEEYVAIRGGTFFKTHDGHVTFSTPDGTGNV